MYKSIIMKNFNYIDSFTTYFNNKNSLTSIIYYNIITALNTDINFS